MLRLLWHCQVGVEVPICILPESVPFAELLCTTGVLCSSNGSDENHGVAQKERLALARPRPTEATQLGFVKLVRVVTHRGLKQHLLQRKGGYHGDRVLHHAWGENKLRKNFIRPQSSYGNKRVTPSSLFLCGYFLSFAEYGYGYSVNFTFCYMIKLLLVSIRTWLYYGCVCKGAPVRIWS